MDWFDKVVNSNEKLVSISIGILAVLAIIAVVNIIKAISLSDIKKNSDLIVLQNQELKNELDKIKSKLENKD